MFGTGAKETPLLLTKSAQADMTGSRFVVLAFAIAVACGPGLVGGAGTLPKGTVLRRLCLVL